MHQKKSCAIPYDPLAAKEHTLQGINPPRLHALYETENIDLGRPCHQLLKNSLSSRQDILPKYAGFNKDLEAHFTMVNKVPPIYLARRWSLNIALRLTPSTKTPQKSTPLGVRREYHGGVISAINAVVYDTRIRLND